MISTVESQQTPSSTTHQDQDIKIMDTTVQAQLEIDAKTATELKAKE